MSPVPTNRQDAVKDTRTETDTFGPIEVPAERYWGAQTQRSLQNFRIGGERMPAPLIQALGLVKQAAALVNKDLGELEPRIADAIAAAAAEVVQGKYDDEFPLVVWQTGSGTQSNMNANEVIAALANEALGGKRGGKIAGAPERPRQPRPVLERFLSDGHAHRRGARDRSAPAAGAAPPSPRPRRQGESLRGHRQDRPHPSPGRDAGDARPGILRIRRAGRARDRADRGDASRAFCVGAGRHRRRHRPQRASATSPRPSPRRSAELTALPFTSAANKFEALASHDALVFTQGALASLAAGLFKIANDIRLMGSGPRSGIGEISLPENEPGSSIMPGKVNPTQAEAMTMVCAQVIGNATTATFAGSQGHFELNVFKPVIANAVLQSIRLLADAAVSFADNCVVGIEPNRERLDELLGRSLMLVTALAPKIGYDKAAAIAKSAHKNGTTLKEEAVRSGHVTAEEFDAVVRPETMLGPG